MREHEANELEYRDLGEGQVNSVGMEKENKGGKEEGKGREMEC